MTAAIGLRDGQRRARPLSKNPRAGQQLIFLACAWLLPFACAPGSQHAAVTPPSRAVSTAVPPPASSAQPTQTVGAGAGADTGARTRTAARSEPSPFVEGVRLGYRAQLNIAGRRAVLTTDNLLLGLHDDGVRIEPNLLEGLQWDHAAYPRVFGSMPESGWLVRNKYVDHESRRALSRWSGSEWVNVDRLLRIGDRDVIAVSPWSNGRMLMLVNSEFEGQPYFVQVGGAGGVLPQLPSAVRDEFLCLHALQPGALSALPSGEVYLAGRRCSVKGGDGLTSHGVTINSWAPGQTQAKVTVPPGLSEKEVSAGELRSILAISSKDIFIAGTRQPYTEDGQQPASAYLAHFDGKSWRPFSVPPVERIEELQRAPDGRLWARGDGQLWSTDARISESAHWQRLVLPEFATEADENSVSSFWVQDNEQVWATLGGPELSYLVRTQRGSAPLSAPSDQEVAQLSSALEATAGCQSFTLVLLTLPRNAPKDADMPRIRAALRGHTELEGNAQFIELPFLTRRYLGVRGDLDTLRATREILSEAHVPGIAPELRCLNGAPTRTFAVDFRPKPGQAPSGKRIRRRSTGFVFDLRNP